MILMIIEMLLVIVVLLIFNRIGRTLIEELLNQVDLFPNQLRFRGWFLMIIISPIIARIQHHVHLGLDDLMLLKHLVDAHFHSSNRG